MVADGGPCQSAAMELRLVFSVIFACAFAPVSVAAELRPPATFFASIEGTFDGLHASTGIDLPLTTLQSGGALMVRIATGSGLSRWPADPRDPFPVLEVKQSARLLMGWRFSGSWGVATLFGGLAVERRVLPQGFPDPQTGLRVGPAVVFDAWLKPMERVAVQVYAEIATPYSAASLRIAPGYEVAERIFVGPEASVGLHHGTLRSRAGLHVTGLRIGDVGLRLSGGYAQDRGGRGGAYGTLSLWRNY